MMLDWDHKVTDKSEVIKVFATIFPMVSLPSFHSPAQLLTSTRTIASSHSRTARHKHCGLFVCGHVVRTT
jgi:C-22 sterol desaturase